MLGLGPLELGIILLLVLIIFGAGKLPEIGVALGKGIHDFRKEAAGEVRTTAGDEMKGQGCTGIS